MKLDSKLINLHRLGWLFVIILAGSGFTLGIVSILTIEQASIVIEWTTASELDIVGYNVLRRDADSEPLTQVNFQLILPVGDPLTGGNYVFEDINVKVGETYTYILEDVETTGEKHRHGPITQKADNDSIRNLILSGVILLNAGIFTWLQIRKALKNRDNPAETTNIEKPGGND